MTATRRRAKTKRRARATLPSPRRSVTRREYAELVVRLGSLELQTQRNRAALDLQGKRIAQLQEQLKALESTAAAISALPLAATTPTVES